MGRLSVRVPGPLWKLIEDRRRQLGLNRSEFVRGCLLRSATLGGSGDELVLRAKKRRLLREIRQLRREEWEMFQSDKSMKRSGKWLRAEHGLPAVPTRLEMDAEEASHKIREWYAQEIARKKIRLGEVLKRLGETVELDDYGCKGGDSS